MAEQAYNHLTTIMHVGISHFSGRNLPGLIRKVLGEQVVVSPSTSLSVDDRRMIKGWASQLDAWLMRYHRPTSEMTLCAVLTPEHEQRGPSDANVILLQYQLHKLFVFSIYYSVHPMELSQPLSPEMDELLVTARGALQLQRKGLGVWSNWDLVVGQNRKSVLMIDNHVCGAALARLGTRGSTGS